MHVIIGGKTVVEKLVIAQQEGSLSETVDQATFPGPLMAGKFYI